MNEIISTLLWFLVCGLGLFTAWKITNYLFQGSSEKRGSGK